MVIIRCYRSDILPVYPFKYRCWSDNRPLTWESSRHTPVCLAPCESQFSSERAPLLPASGSCIAAPLHSAFSLQPSNVVLMFLPNLVSNSLAEKDAMERNHFAFFAGDRRDRYFHFVCHHANSRVSSASALAGSRCRSVCIFAGAVGQLAGPEKAASASGCRDRVRSVFTGCCTVGRWSRSLDLH